MNKKRIVMNIFDPDYDGVEINEEHLQLMASYTADDMVKFAEWYNDLAAVEMLDEINEKFTSTKKLLERWKIEKTNNK